MSKPEVLFLHGAGGGAWEWNVWRRIFQAHGIAVHVPDFLPSPLGLEKTSLEDYRSQVHQQLSVLRSPKIIIGASLGGLLALMMAEYADAMVLINPILPAPWHAQMPKREAYPAIIPWRAKTNLQNTCKALFDSDAATCLFAFRLWRDESGTVLNSAMRGVDIVRTGKPILLMASEQDADIPFLLAKSFATNMNATFINLPNTSHVGPLLGKNAAQCATQAVAYLNGIFP